jgi:hypothetical protein
VSPIDPGANAFEFDFPDECSFLNDLSDDDNSVAGALSDAFVRDPHGVSSHSIVYSTHQKAGNRVDQLSRSPGACGATLEEHMRRLLGEADVTVGEFSFESLPFAGLGDESAAIRLSVTGEGQDGSVEVVQDLIALRVGNVVASLAYTTTDAEPDRPLEEDLMSRLEQRARAAANSLKKG